MKAMFGLWMFLAFSNVFAGESECLDQVTSLIYQIQNSVESLEVQELDSREITEYGLSYTMIRFAAVGQDANGSFEKLIIVYDRPNSKCLIRNIL